MENTPESVKKFLDKAQFNLYSLIWKRFVASQMSPAIYDQTSADIVNDGLLFRVSGSSLKFDGHLRVYGPGPDELRQSNDDSDGDMERELPPLKEGMELKLEALLPRQHFTQPPPAFNEASLIKELEDKGIGRPSTYAEIVSTIQKRKYVEIVDKRFKPTVLGRIIAKLLVESFPRLLDPLFTAEMESDLDMIEGGARSWTDTLTNFYQPFQSELGQAEKEMKNIKREGVPIIEVCPECNSPLVLRSGRYGVFLGCSAYPDCDFTRNIDGARGSSSEPVPTNEKCPKCGAQLLLRDGKAGPFLSCSEYPDCKMAMPLSTGVKCPKCGKGELAERRSKRGKTFYSCDQYPKCDYSLWNKPVEIDCPNDRCDSKIMQERSTQKSGKFLQCPECKEKMAIDEN
jgi:DNA topoisomerase-1